ncbi:uncharacterized protein LOC117122136 [Anneissia japonica]|uniref:uncharacterized protein LOC117122136 n=1 Tax=Anneissia japonica TaxID=1529436 RepID=UPI0014258325|nr:uncharacterized protein LOC117122136 [Anneissia japonica]XP_033123514.1 uncharacterized protein LOC117122136 [Anneissia japonica]
MDFLYYCFYCSECIKHDQNVDELNNFASSSQSKDGDEKDGSSRIQKNGNRLRWRVKEEVHLRPDDDDESRLHYKTSMTIPANPETDETVYSSEVFYIPKSSDTSEFSTSLYIYPREVLEEPEEAFINIISDEDLVDSVVKSPIFSERLDEDWTWSRKMYATLTQHCYFMFYYHLI